jgi:hypothetical protein
VTISDFEIETRLRDLGARTASLDVPHDLAERTRQRHRSLRRREFGLVAAGLAAALVLVGVPVVASTIAADGTRGEVAAPGRTEAPPSVTALYDVPTRGSLAGDEEWLTALASREWVVIDPAYALPGGPTMPNAPLATRRVAFADDVPSGRVALVLGREDGGGLVHVWFTGPEDASPEQMTQATTPSNGGAGEVRVLLDSQDALSESVSVVVVALPGDTADQGLPAEVDAQGKVTRTRVPLELEDGIGVSELDGPRLLLWPATDVRVYRNTDDPVSMMSESSARMGPDALPAEPLADPRGLLGGADTSLLEDLTGMHLAEYGLPAGQVDTTLLAAGPLGAGGGYGHLVGATFPSGATGAWVVTSTPARPDAGASVSALPFAPAGTALLDRFLAVRAMGGLLVSAPSGVSALVVGDDGVVLATVPLQRGSGTGPLPLPHAFGVRILDAAGDVVTEVPITDVER